MVRVKTQIADSLLPLALLFLFMLAPSLGLLKIWPLTSAVTAGLTLVFVSFFFGIVLVTRRDSIFRFNAAAFLFLGLIAALIVSVWFNNYTYDATWRWYLIALVAAVFTVVAASELKAPDPRKYHERISRLLWLGCFVYCVMSLLKYYGFLTQVFSWIEPGSGRLSGIWVQPNLTTTMGWLGLLAGAVSFSEKQQKSWWFVSILVFGWTLACAASRMSWLMVVGLMALIFVSRLSRYHMAETRIASRLLTIGLILVVIQLLVVPILNQPLREALVSFGLLDQDAGASLINRDAFHDSARLTEFEKVFSAVDSFTWKDWLFGVGPGNYPIFSYRADMALPPEGLVQGTWLHSHNLFSMVFIEFGLFGLAVVLAFAVGIAFTVLRSPMDLPGFFSIGAIGLLFIHSNLEFPLWYFWFLILFCLLLTNLFNVGELRGDAKWLKPIVGLSGLLMVLALLVNVGYQYANIAGVALNPQRDRQSYQDLSLLANDSLMGPYAILRKYRDFAPENANIDWQLREVRRMKRWQPRDLVVLREFSLLILKKDISQACEVATSSAYRYPRSAPIMLEHSFLASSLSSAEITDIANCIEKGLAPRGETIQSMQEKNKSKTL